MIWEKEADAAIKKVPFFVRKKVRNRVETFVADKGGDRVTLEDVQALKKSSFPRGAWKTRSKAMMFPPASEGRAVPIPWPRPRPNWSKI